MAAIRDSAITLYSATTSSMVCEMPTHVTGDLLVACVGKDSAVAFTTPSGWTLIQASISTGAAGGIYAKRATSSSETVTFSLTIETCLATVIAIQDVYGSTVADAIPTSAISGADDATLPFTGIGLTTGYANSLLIHARYQDTTIGTAHLPPWVNIFAGDVANGGLTVAYSFEPTASTAITAPEMWSAGQDDGRSIMVEIRDGSSGAIKPPYIPLDVIPSVLISPLTGTTGAVDKGDYVAAASIAITSVAGKTVTGVSVAATVDSGYNPFRGSTRNAGVSSTTNLNHTEFNLTSTQDITTGGLIFGTYLNLTPRDYVDTGKAVQGGIYLLAGSATTAWRAWVVGGQFSKTEKSDARNNFLVEPTFSTTEYGSAGSPNFASLDYLAFGSAGYYGLPAILWNELWELRIAIIAGGTSTNPIGFENIVNTINLGCGNIPLLQQVGSLATVWIPIQFGGNENIGVSCNLNTFQFPQQADEIDYVNFHVSNNKIGIEFYGTGSSDYLHFTNCLFTSPSPYYWRFNASHSTSASIDFSGSTVVGASVTLQSTSDLDSVTFINCPTFTQNGATLTNCTFSNTKVIASSPENAALISNSSFISSGTGYAIEISGTAAAMTLTNVNFTNYAVSDGSTGNEAIYVNIGSGSMTISINGGTMPSIRTAGASVTVTNSKTITITVKDELGANVENARVAIYKSSDMTELLNSLTNASGIATTSVNYISDIPVIIRVRKSSAAPKYVSVNTSGTITNNGLTATVTFVAESIAASTTNATIAGDFVVNTTYKTIKHTADAVIYSANELYTWLMDYFDDTTTIDDAIPMSAQTPTEYTLLNGWYIDDESFKFLSGGAIQTSGWASGGIRLKPYDATGAGTTFTSADIGRTITETDSGDTGTIVNYDERTATEIGYVWIRPDTAGDTFADVNSAYSVGGGSTAVGVFTAASSSGENIWSNIFTLGSIVSGTSLDVYQNDIQITPWWTSGQIDVLVKVKEAGTEIDSGNLTILARKYSTLYDHYLIDASSGRNPVPLAAFNDGNNQTAVGTVGAAPYTNITFDFGYYSGNLNNGNGAQPYDVIIDCATLTVTQVYEYLKYVTRTGSSTTLNGVNGEFYTGVGDIRLAYTGETSGPFTEGSAITSSSGGTGYIVSLIDSGTTGILIIRNTHGTFIDTNTITSGATSATINGVPDTVSASKQAPFGTFAGGKFFGARGVWITNYAGSDGNSFSLIDSTNTTQAPPATISITVNGLLSGDQVGVYRTTGDNEVIDKSVYASHASSNTSGLGTFTVTSSIAADTPSTGNLRVVNRSATGTIVDEQTYAYVSWTGTVFTLSGTLSQSYNGDDTAYVPYIDINATSSTASVSITYASTRYIVTHVRKKGIIPFVVKGQLTNANLTITAIRTTDTIVAP